MAANYLLLGLDQNGASINVYRHQETSLCSLLKESSHDVSQYRFTRNGVPIQDPSDILQLTQDEKEAELVVVKASPRLLGGKGGFGALIRAMGMRVNKNRGRDASRDLSGRRMRDVNAEKQLAEWAKKEPERQKKKVADKTKKRKEMLEGPRHFFNDPEYMQQLEENEAMVEEAIKQGTSNGRKRERGEEREEKSAKGKKKMLMLGIDELLSSSEEESEEEEEEGSSPVVKKYKETTTSEDDIPVLKDMGNIKHLTVPASPNHLSPTQSTTSKQPENNTSNDSTVINSDTTVEPTHHEATMSQVDHLPSDSNTDTDTDTTNPNTDTTNPNTDTTNPNTDTTNPNTDTTNPNTDTTNPNTDTTNPNTDTTNPNTDTTNPNTDATNIDSSKTYIALEEINEEMLSQFNLQSYNSLEDLEREGPHLLKAVLQKRGLKCGGTLRERAQRLMSIKGIPQDEIDPSLLASNNGKKNKRGKRSNKS